MGEIVPSTAECLERIRKILAETRAAALQTVNAAMIAAYWEIGREIVEEEQRGEERAAYGARLMKQLSAKLTAEFGRGFSVTNLRLIRQFYATYAGRHPVAIPRARRSSEIRHSPSSECAEPPVARFRPELSWTHYRVLMRVSSSEVRSFYEVECAKARWSVRELERQIGSLLFERLSRSRDKEGVLALAREGQEASRPDDLVKDPYVLEFVGLPEAARWLEGDLEQALIDRLQQFMLELGRDLFFAGRQKRLTIGGSHYYIDLVFYHRVLRCFLLIDLKVGPLTEQDLGQMLLYTGYYEAEDMREDENPPIGLVLCTDKNEAMVRYTLAKNASQVFASRYQLHLPSEEELAQELRRERDLLELQGPVDEAEGSSPGA